MFGEGKEGSVMDAMAKTRESLLHDAIREADRANDAARSFMAEMFKAADDAERTRRRLANLQRAFRSAVIVGAVGWLLAWTLALWGWMTR